MTVLAGGILLLTFKGGRTLARVDSRAVAFALATSLTITAYTLVDGIGARLAGSSLAYTVWLFIGDGVTMAIYGWLRIGPALMGDLRAHWRIAVAGAALSTAAYAIAIWAMTVAPIALVAALRETSVLFAALFATVFCANRYCRSALRPPVWSWLAPCCCAFARRSFGGCGRRRRGGWRDRTGLDGIGTCRRRRRGGARGQVRPPRQLPPVDAEPTVLRQQAVLQALHSAREVTLSTKVLMRRRQQKGDHGRHRHGGGCAGVRGSISFSAVPKDALMRVSITSTE